MGTTMHVYFLNGDSHTHTCHTFIATSYTYMGVEDPKVLFLGKAVDLEWESREQSVEKSGNVK